MSLEKIHSNVALSSGLKCVVKLVTKAFGCSMPCALPREPRNDSHCGRQRLQWGMLPRTGDGTVKHLSTNQHWDRGGRPSYGVEVRKVPRAGNA